MKSGWLAAFCATFAAEVRHRRWVIRTWLGGQGQEVPGSSERWRLDTGMEMAFQTKPDCEQRLKARVQFFSRMGSHPTPFLACLPDTVDPRGLKRQ